MIGCLIATAAFALFIRSQKTSVQGGGQLVLKLGHGLDTGHPVHQAMERMKERLEELSGGTVSIDIYPSAVLGSETQCIEQLQNGSLAMTKTSAAAMENFIPSMSVFSYPYVFRNDEHYWSVIDGEIGNRLLQGGKDKFLRGLCYYDAGSRHFYTKNAPIRTPDDLKGLKVRVMNSPTAIEMVKAMGGAPTPIAWGELYSALAQGTVDGAENNLPSFSTNKHYEVCKHFTLDGHTRIPDMLLVSTKVWDRLDPQTQQWVQQAATESSTYQRELWQTMTAEAAQQAQDEGVTIYEVDTEAFAKKVAPMHQAVENESVNKLLLQIAEVK
ncbi:tripartite ATP-independent transporter solute receptor, DctP family [Neorhodopirellula lusitana]|uniref:Tripartite ATP-independent transporter solute receptor, DctP family n=1 Tax=Neorhodopirellula lusitana TaxID=445327 RepID=A0ABY1PT83_9BACT|nr:tripartite ATP-independent transporter solute receptor, DctP family [Neorhodopirellula lusitana]